MAYCTKADILAGNISEELLIQLTDDNGTGVVDDTKVASAIKSATAIIDGYCAKRYPVPLNPVPELAKDMCVAIAIFKLYGNRQGAPDFRRKDRDDAVSLLKDISKKNATLGEDSPAELSGDTSDNGVEMTSSTPIFTRTKLQGF